MQVRGERGHPKSARLWAIGNIIEVPHQNRLLIVRYIGRPRAEAVKGIELLERQIRTDEYGRDLLYGLIKLLRREYRQGLVRRRASLSRGGVGSDGRSRCQLFHRLMDRHDGHFG